MYLILSILIAMGEQFPKPESEIRFGWGISYNYIAQLHHNLNKYDVVVGLETPDFRAVAYYSPLFLLILSIVESGMMNSTLTQKCCTKHVIKFGQLT